METNDSSHVNTEQQGIEELTERYQRLNKRRIEADTNLRNAKERLGELKEKAREEFGTDDLEQLKQELDALRRENEEKRSQYQTSLDEIEGELKKVEREHGSVNQVSDPESQDG